LNITKATIHQEHKDTRT